MKRDKKDEEDGMCLFASLLSDLKSVNWCLNFVIYFHFPNSNWRESIP